MLPGRLPAGKIALDSATISVLRSADTNDDCPWGTARLKFDFVAMLNAPKECVESCYLSIDMSSMS